MLSADLKSPQPLRADFTHPSPTVVSAYSICRDAENVIDLSQDRWPPNDQAVKVKLINIRILGHLLCQRYLLSDTAIATVAASIVSCRRTPAGTGREEAADLEALDELGEFYRNYLLRPFRKLKCRTPDVSSPPSRPSCDLTKEEVDHILAETPKSYSQWRDLAMQREDFRCIVTRIADKSYAEGHPDIYMAQTLKFCHIFAESTNYDVEDNAKQCDYDSGQGIASNTLKSDYSRNLWSVLKSLGYTDIASDFATAEKIHSLENVMMMIETLQDYFDSLELWFEPVQDVPNRYRMRTKWGLPKEWGADGQEVTFQSTDPRLPLPNPEYLRLHAACCRVARMSGASGLFDQLARDMASDPDPTREAPAFARALHAHLDHLSLTAIEARWKHIADFVPTRD